MAKIPVNATLAFIIGNIAASTDQETVVLLTIDGVWLATRATLKAFTGRVSSRSSR